MSIDRSFELEIFRDTMQIIKNGYYEKDGKRISLKLSAKDTQKTAVFLPEEVEKIVSDPCVLEPLSPGSRCVYSCRNMDSFAVARMRMSEGALLSDTEPKEVLVLNLANPVNPGGGVRKGARAQEEDLCRKSSLLLSLESKAASKYYIYNRGLNTFMGSDAMMITPRVEIVKDERGELLDDTAVCAVLTCAAPMIIYGKEGLSEQEYEAMLYRRIVGMLGCAAYCGYRNLVLGAWGCGAFGNDARLVSDLFKHALDGFDYNGHGADRLFKSVDFAVLDRSASKYNFNEFSRNFGGEKSSRDDGGNKNNKYLDRIRGCLIGGAAGDALGYTVEFMDENEIFFGFGKRGITEYRPGHAGGKALISDDTQMTLFTGNGLLYGLTAGCRSGDRGNPEYYVAKAYRDWLRTQEIDYPESRRQPYTEGVTWLTNVPELYSCRAPGMTCLSALRTQTENGQLADDHILHPVNNSKGCGGVMRVAPVGFRHVGDLRELDLEGARMAAITHGHSLGYMPAAVLTHIVNRLVFSDSKMSLKDVVKEAEDTVASIFSDDSHIGELTALIDLAAELSENNEPDLDNIHRLGEGWVGDEALAIAIYCALRYKDDFSAGLIVAVNHRGDSDSTGAVTGNILGALFGYDAVEEKWKTDLELRDVILEIADDMYRACAEDIAALRRDPDWVKKYIEAKWK